MKKKVIIINNRLGYYGAENVLINMVNHMDQSRYDITLLTLVQSNAEKIIPGIKYKYIFAQNKKFSTKVKNKIKLFLNYKCLAQMYCRGYDIAVAFKMGECARLVGYCNAKKKFCWIHSNVSELTEKYSYSFKNIDSERIFLKRFDSLVAVSEACKQSFIKKYKGSYHIKVIYNPIDSAEIRNKAKEILTEKEKELFQGDQTIIGTVARIDWQKGIDRLINISQRLSSENIKHKLIIVGDGADYTKFSNEIAAKNLNNIYLIGFQKNPYKFLKQFDLFVCSSICESYSLVVNEALALDIPVISTKCGGPEEVLQYGRYGILVDNNETALYEAIKKFLLGSKMETEKYSPDQSIVTFIGNLDKLFYDGGKE